MTTSYFQELNYYYFFIFFIFFIFFLTRYRRLCTILISFSNKIKRFKLLTHGGKMRTRKIIAVVVSILFMLNSVIQAAPIEVLNNTLRAQASNLRISEAIKDSLMSPRWVSTNNASALLVQLAQENRKLQFEIFVSRIFSIAVLRKSYLALKDNPEYAVYASKVSDRIQQVEKATAKSSSAGNIRAEIDHVISHLRKVAETELAKGKDQNSGFYKADPDLCVPACAMLVSRGVASDEMKKYIVEFATNEKIVHAYQVPSKLALFIAGDRSQAVNPDEIPDIKARSSAIAESMDAGIDTDKQIASLKAIRANKIIILPYQVRAAASLAAHGLATPEDVQLLKGISTRSGFYPIACGGLLRSGETSYLDELKEIAKTDTILGMQASYDLLKYYEHEILRAELREIAAKVVPVDGGILAADESTGTAGKRLESVGLANTSENRQEMRRLIITVPGQEMAGVSAVILYGETFDNVDAEGRNLIQQHLLGRGILPGIKTDAGLIDDPDSLGEKLPNPKGLEQLPEMLKTYKEKGAVFTKWRITVSIDASKGLPTEANIRKNAEILAKSAKQTQQAGLVPIVEPEVLLDGAHDITASYKATTRTLEIVFEELVKAGVWLDGVILKTSMILSGNKAENRADKETVGYQTLKGLLKTVPSELPAVVFLSGGQEDDEVNENLDAIARTSQTKFIACRDEAAVELKAEGKIDVAAKILQLTESPWQLSYSFGRGLQRPGLKVWAGKPENFAKAQEALLEAARTTQNARLGILHQPAISAETQISGKTASAGRDVIVEVENILTRAGVPDSEIIPVLLQGLRSNLLYYSIPAAMALSNLDPAERAPYINEIIPQLLQGLRYNPLYYSILSAMVLSNLAPAERTPYIKELIPQLLQGLRSGDLYYRILSAMVLSNLDPAERAPYIKEIIPVLLQGLRSGDLDYSIPAAMALSNLAPAERAPYIKELIPQLLQGLRSGDLDYSIPVAMVLSNLAPAERTPYIKELIPQLLQGLRSGDLDYSILSALAFSNLDPAERTPYINEIIPQLLQGLRSGDLDYSIPLAMALSNLDPAERTPYIKELIPQLLQGLRSNLLYYSIPAAVALSNLALENIISVSIYYHPSQPPVNITALTSQDLANKLNTEVFAGKDILAKAISATELEITLSPEKPEQKVIAADIRNEDRLASTIVTALNVDIVKSSSSGNNTDEEPRIVTSEARGADAKAYSGAFQRHFAEALLPVEDSMANIGDINRLVSMDSAQADAVYSDHVSALRQVVNNLKDLDLVIRPHMQKRDPKVTEAFAKVNNEISFAETSLLYMQDSYKAGQLISPYMPGQSHELKKSTAYFFDEKDMPLEHVQLIKNTIYRSALETRYGCKIIPSSEYSPADIDADALVIVSSRADEITAKTGIEVIRLNIQGSSREFFPIDHIIVLGKARLAEDKSAIKAVYSAITRQSLTSEQMNDFINKGILALNLPIPTSIPQEYYEQLYRQTVLALIAA
jgi:fructose-bisphosphate aldolase, class I